MGLFTNNKKLCPICDSPTPRIFPTSVEGKPICKECKRKVDLPDGMLDGMTLEDFCRYMDCYNENKVLRDTFSESIRLAPGIEADNFLLDTTNKLFRLKDEEKAFVFDASNLVSFRILEDTTVLFESAGNVLKCYKSDVPERVRSMSAQISQLAVQIQVQEELERIERERQRERERNGEKETEPVYRPQPDIELPVLFRYFYLELTLEHPYWNRYRGKAHGTCFRRNYPSVDDFLASYNSSIDKLHGIATCLMQMIHPGAGEEVK